MNKITQYIPRPIHKEEDEKLGLEQIIKDVTTLVSIAALPKDRTRLSRSITTTSALLSLSSIGRTVFQYVQKVAHRGEFTLKLAENDFMFQLAENWLMDALPEDKKLSVALKSSFNFDPGSPEGRARELTWRLRYDGSVEQELEVAGYTVRVSTEVPENSAKTSEEYRASHTKDRKIVFTCPSYAAREAVVKELYRTATEVVKQQPGFHITRWGSFDRISDITKRSMDSVFLKEGQMDRIIGHLKGFLANKEAMENFGLPYRTGIMLYGTPGSGKTSTSTVLANELNMDVYYVSIRSMEGDQDFENTIAKVPANSIVILEDIDAVNASKDRDQDHNSTEFANDVSLSSLLNVLDGMQSPPGVIFIMTTNKLERLDEAVIRPGRVDLMEELNELDSYQLRSMLEYYTGDSYEDKYVPALSPADGITSAEIVQVVRGLIPNTEEYAPAIIAHVEERLLTSAAA